VEQKDTPAGAGSLAPPIYFLFGNVNLIYARFVGY